MNRVQSAARWSESDKSVRLFEGFVDQRALKDAKAKHPTRQTVFHDTVDEYSGKWPWQKALEKDEEACDLVSTSGTVTGGENQIDEVEEEVNEIDWTLDVLVN